MAYPNKNLSSMTNLKNKLTFIDLFAGCGGLSLGLEQAGFFPLYVNELNNDAMETYLINRKEEYPHLIGIKYQSSDIKEVVAEEGYFKWLLNNLNENIIPEYWVHLRPTTPLRAPEKIDEAIDVILNDDTATSLRSGHKAPESPLKWFVKEDKYFKGLIKNLTYFLNFNLISN